MSSLSCISFLPVKLYPAPCPIGPKMSLNSTPNSDPMSTVTKLLWGQALPPGLLISSVRKAWSSTWHLMMSQLAPSDEIGSYTRPASKFRIDPTQLAPSTFHLYVGLPCPWAHRTLIVRALKGLEKVVMVSVASPGADGSWEFGNSDVGLRDGDNVLNPSRDNVNGCQNLKEVYKMRKGGYDGRSTVPMLWDVKRKEVFCNESYDIIEFFNSGLNEFAENPDLDLSPPHLKEMIEEWNRLIYPNVNNGVYRCGFAQSQQAYDRAVTDLFENLEKIDEHLGKSRYLCGDTLTLADICLFTTLIRFDPVYNVLFKCTKKKLVEYPNLHSYMCEIYQMPKVSSTCNLEAIMDGYYRMLFPLNPGNIKPVIPSACEKEALLRPHNRDALGSPVDAVVS